MDAKKLFCGLLKYRYLPSVHDDISSHISESEVLQYLI